MGSTIVLFRQVFLLRGDWLKEHGWKKLDTYYGMLPYYGIRISPKKQSDILWLVLPAVIFLNFKACWISRFLLHSFHETLKLSNRLQYFQIYERVSEMYRPGQVTRLFFQPCQIQEGKWSETFQHVKKKSRNVYKPLLRAHDRKRLYFNWPERITWKIVEVATGFYLNSKALNLLHSQAVGFIVIWLWEHAFTLISGKTNSCSGKEKEMRSNSEL